MFDAGQMPYVLDPERVRGADRHAQGRELDAVLGHMEVLAEAGLITVVAFTSPSSFDRIRARERFSNGIKFIEVYFKADVETCRGRLAALGRDPHEADLAYEVPEDPDHVVDGNLLDVEREVDRIVRALERRGILTAS